MKEPFRHARTAELLIAFDGFPAIQEFVAWLDRSEVALSKLDAVFTELRSLRS